MTKYSSNWPDFHGVNQEIRINRLKREIQQLAQGKATFGNSPDCPKDIEENFLRYILTYERAQWTTHFEQLTRCSVKLPPPEEMDDHELTAKLWELIHELARHQTFLECTNHLNDRALYTHLWRRGLRERIKDMDEVEGGFWHINLVGSGSEEDNRLYLKYYADEVTRQQWREEWPDIPIPTAEKPGFNRDKDLPKPPE